MKDMSATVLEEVIKIGKAVSRVETTIESHGIDINDIKTTLIKIDSKHNADYQQYVDSREKLEARIVPLEDDYHKRMQCTEENRVERKRLFFSTWGEILKIVASLLVVIFLAIVLARFGVDLAHYVQVKV